MTRPEPVLVVREASSMAALPRQAWNALVDADHPFMRHEFLHALEASGAVSPATGWVPRHLTLWQGERLVGALPHYDKYHSRGEYVFDWAWADAWERAGGAYYPKGLTAIPFSPAPGPRMALAAGLVPELACACFAEVLERQERSSWHLLFASATDVDAWQRARPGLIARHGVQFQWVDRGFGDIEGFLAAMTAKRRKAIRRERRLVAEQGLTLRRLVGRDIDEAALAHFYRCYQITYLERGQQGYLDLDFFLRLRESLPQALVLIQATLGDKPVAAALCLQGERTLYGRYWGSEVVADCLHFEACYYQGIEHCLEHGLTRFDPGTQGEHKVSRGFAPVALRSLHHIADPHLHAAVTRFCRDEWRHVDAYCRHVAQALPFKAETPN